MTAASLPTQQCVSCRKQRPVTEFIGRRGKPVTWCQGCRARYERYHPTHEIPYHRGPRVESVRALVRNVAEDRHTHLRVVDEFEVVRPKTRGACELCAGCQAWRDGGEPDSQPACGHTPSEAIARSRPCVFVGCKHSLFLDLSQYGAIVHNWPNLEPDAIDADKSCALDVADSGGATLEEIGDLANVSRERIRQIEYEALDLVRRRSCKPGDGKEEQAAADLLEFSAAPDFAGAKTVVPRRGAAEPPTEALSPVEDETVEDPPTRISFFSEGEQADKHVCESVWSMFSRDSNSRGFRCRPRNTPQPVNAPPRKDGGGR